MDTILPSWPVTLAPRHLYLLTITRGIVDLAGMRGQDFLSDRSRLLGDPEHSRSTVQPGDRHDTPRLSWRSLVSPPGSCRRPGHGDDTSRSKNGKDGRQEAVRRSSAPHDGGVEHPSEVRDQGFEPAVDDARSAESKLPHDCPQERCAALSGLQERHLHPRAHDLDRDPGKASAGPNVDDRARTNRQDPQEEKAIRHQGRGDPGGISRRHESLGLLPFQ